ncbi:MAG: hypothetical protein LC646_04965 [Xanthomonadaceae bacterium]|nr:hypothetical protein [Xanthomonadaceae bacterium]
MNKVWTGAVGLLAVMCVSPLPAALAETGPKAKGGSAESREAPRSSRLRFRSGPVCMCSNGLGEEEIEAAERKRLESIVEPQDGKRR